MCMIDDSHCCVTWNLDSTAPPSTAFKSSSRQPTRMSVPIVAGEGWSIGGDAYEPTSVASSWLSPAGSEPLSWSLLSDRNEFFPNKLHVLPA